MADTFTTNLNLTKPEPGAAEDTWGISLNADLDALDAIFSSSGTQINLNPNQVNFGDNKKAVFGAGSDLQIFHDGHSHILNSTGDLFLKNTSDDKDIIFQSDDGSGGLETYFYVDGSGKRVIFEQNTRILDNFYAAFGSDADLRIFHDGSNSYIKQSSGATGNLIIEQDLTDADILFKGDDGGSSITALTLDMSDDGAATFNAGVTATDITATNTIRSANNINSSSHNILVSTTNKDNTLMAYGVDRNGTVTGIRLDGKIIAPELDISGDIDVTGNATFDDNGKAIFGGGSDLQIYHDGSNSYITESNATGNLYIKGTHIYLQNSSGQDALNLINGNAFIKSGGATKLQTTSTGIDVTGALAVNSGTTDTAATFTSSDTAVAVNFVASDNSMQIATSGTDGILKNNGAGSLRFFNNGSETARIDASGNVGIGESSPLGKLHVKSADSGASADGSADELVIEGSGHSGLSILSGSSSYGTILFSDSESAAAGRLRYEHNNNALNFGTNGSWNRMYINSSGNVGIGDISPDTALHITRSNGSIIRLERNDTSIAANDVYGGIEFEGQDTDASSAGVRGKILGIAEGTTGEFALTFETADSNGSSTEALRIDSSQNVGIGTTSPAQKLHVAGGFIHVDAGLGITWDNTHERIEQSDGTLEFFTNNSQAMTLSGSNLGLGTTSPTGVANYRVLQLRGGSTSNGGLIRLETSDGTSGVARFYAGSGSTVLESTSNTPLSFGTNGTTAVTIDTSQNVGIGTSSPSYPLEVQSGGVGTVLRAGTSFVSIDSTGSAASPSLILNGDSDTGIYHPAANTLAMSTGGSERLRLDASGNLLVGTTTSSLYNQSSTEGVAIHSDHIQIARSSNICFTPNRYGTDGSIIQFRKDGTSVGAINAVSGDLAILSTSSGHKGLRFGSGAITPTTNTAAIDNGNTDLGGNSIRFKDLYLAGAANVGSVTATGNVTAFSDERLKDNIQTLQGSKVLDMRGVSFTKDGKASSGVIAQEIEKVAPELVHTAKDEMGTKSVAYGNLVGYLIEAVKDQQKQINDLKERLDNDS